jgi:hypothetical protein
LSISLSYYSIYEYILVVCLSSFRATVAYFMIWVYGVCSGLKALCIMVAWVSNRCAITGLWLEVSWGCVGTDAVRLIRMVVQ